MYAARVGVWTAEGPRLASLRSRALREAPIEGGVAVGDWVLVGAAGESADEVVVEAVLPRRTVLLRQAAGERAEPQAIAANVDRVFVVTDADRDFNVRRLERYLRAIAAGGAEGHVVVTKADLGGGLEAALAESRKLAPTLATSARTGLGLDELTRRIPARTTVALVGSSGVGKSALVNRLLGKDVQIEGAVRAYDGRGRHTTTRRELFALAGGGLLIDTPGMREFKPWLVRDESSAEAFEDLAAVGRECRYRDCRHEREPGCAVRAAVAEGRLSGERVAAWTKLEQERAEHGARQAAFTEVENKRQARAAATKAARVWGRKKNG